MEEGTDSSYERGRALDDEGRFEEAQVLYREAMAQGDGDALVALAISLTRGGRPEDREEAETLLKQNLEEDPDADPMNYANLLARWPDREEEAFRLYRQAIAQGSTEAHHNLALLLQVLDRTEEAMAEFRKGAEAGDAWAWDGLGTLLQEEERLEEAEEPFIAAIQGGYLEAHGNLGDLYFGIDRFADAAREYRDAIAAGNSGYRVELAELYTAMERYADAEEEYRASIASGNISSRISLGNLLDDYLDRPDEAEEQFRLAMAAGVDVASAIYNLGICISRQGREEEALEAFRTAADLRSAPAQWRLLRLEREHDPAWAGLDIWTGIANVKPRVGNDPFDGAPGAFVNLLALVRDEAEYQRAITEALEREMGLEVLDIDDIERFSHRLGGLDMDDEVFQQAIEVSPSSPVAIGTFHVYLSED